MIRVSKIGRHTDARLRKIFHNLYKILAFERKTVKKTSSFNLILLMSLKHFFCVLWPFRHIIMHIFFGWTFCLRGLFVIFKFQQYIIPCNCVYHHNNL